MPAGGSEAVGRGLGVGVDVKVRAVAPGFHRTPLWALGRTGRIVQDAGRWREPESTAAGARDAPIRRLFHVVFPHPEGELAADIFEHWLEPTVRGDASDPESAR